MRREAEAIKHNIARTVGHSALRKMAKLAQEELRLEEANQRWAKLFERATVALCLLLVAVALIDSSIFSLVFRAIAAGIGR